MVSCHKSSFGVSVSGNVEYSSNRQRDIFFRLKIASGRGIKVTIVEPGGFRTDFAGSSTKLSEGHHDYDSTVGATARFQRDYNGKQPGDPKKAAKAIVRLTQEQKPPLRLLLGSDAYNGAEKDYFFGNPAHGQAPFRVAQILNRLVAVLLFRWLIPKTGQSKRRCARALTKPASPSKSSPGDYARTVHGCIVFKRFGLALTEKHSPICRKHW